MKSFKMSSLQKLLSFILIAVLLICTVGFAANGWQSTPNDEPDSGNIGDSTDKTDENTDGDNDQQNPDTPSDTPAPPSSDDTDQGEPPDTQNPPENVTEEKKYINPMTGLTVTKEIFEKTPIGFVVNPQMPLYGISNSDLTFEFPIEDGTTRLLSYTKNFSMLWKIGTLEPTRAFISSTSNFFGGIVVSYGNDDVVKYSAWDASKIDLDISKISDCYYVENTLYIYTSKDMIDVATSTNSALTKSDYKTPPFIISEKEVKGNVEASLLTLPFSDIDKTEFYYSELSGQYLYNKSGKRKVDMLNGKNIAFSNVFVLFANATTYEKSTGTELVIDTTGGGTGYYVSKGYLTEIKWNVNENGELVFKSLNGEKLSVNTGNSYIGYYKASQISKVKIS